MKKQIISTEMQTPTTLSLDMTMIATILKNCQDSLLAVQSDFVENLCKTTILICKDWIYSLRCCHKILDELSSEENMTSEDYLKQLRIDLTESKERMSLQYEAIMTLWNLLKKDLFL